MRRWIFNLLTVFSLLFFLTVLTFAIRSIWISDMWYRDTSEMNTVAALEFNRGSIAVFYSDPRYLLDMGPTQVTLGHASGPSSSAGPRYGLNTYLGFGYRYLPTSGANILVPYWAVLLVCALMPGWWVIAVGRRRLHRRRNPTACGNCGYDLRASAGVCPECGKEVSDRAAAS